MRSKSGVPSPAPGKLLSQGRLSWLFCFNREKGIVCKGSIPSTLLKQKSQDSLPWLNSFPGAGDGNRTRVTSLEGWSSTIELHPQKNGRDDRIRTCDILLPKQARYQTAPHPDATLKHYNKNSDVFFSILLAEYTLLTGRYRYF